MVKKGVTKVMSLLLATVVAFAPLPAHAEETEKCTITLKHYTEALEDGNRTYEGVEYNKIPNQYIEVEPGFLFDSDPDAYIGYTLINPIWN